MLSATILKDTRQHRYRVIALLLSTKMCVFLNWSSGQRLRDHGSKTALGHECLC